MSRVFFHSTRSFRDKLSSLFDFVWPVAAGMWNLRWQLKGYLDSAPSANRDQLLGRFVVGSDITGANLIDTCINETWESNSRRFAEIVLVFSLASYEAWLEDTLTIIQRKSISNLKALQSPSDCTRALVDICRPSSPVTMAVFSPELSLATATDLSLLGNMLIAYRYFKDVRNCIIHSGAIADARVIASYTSFSALKPGDLKVSEVPKTTLPLLGKPLETSLRGVVGFSGILRRIATVLDAEFAKAKGAERELLSAWGNTKPVRTLPSDPRKRANFISRQFLGVGLPKPADTEQLAAFLLSHKLVTN